MIEYRMRLKYLYSLIPAIALAAFFTMQGMPSFAKDSANTQKQQARDYYRETQAGNYLSGRFAQQQQDWRQASDYINRLVVMNPENENLQEKAMVLAMGSGESNRAFSLARKVLDHNPDHV